MSSRNSDTENVPVEKGSDTEVHDIPPVAAAIEALDLNPVLQFDVDSPEPVGVSSGSSSATAGTDQTPSFSFSPEDTDLASGGGVESPTEETSGGGMRSKSTSTESDSLSPLDDQQMIEAILEREPEAKVPDASLPGSEDVDKGLVSSDSSSSGFTESKSTDPTLVTTVKAGPSTDVGTQRKVEEVTDESRKETPDLKQEDVKSSAGKTQVPSLDKSEPSRTSSEEQAQSPVYAKRHLASPEETLSPFSGDFKLLPTPTEETRTPAPGDAQLPLSPSEVPLDLTSGGAQLHPSPSKEYLDTVDPLPGLDVPRRPSAVESIQSSTQGTIDQLDSNDSLSEDSPDADYAADVSSLSKLSGKEKRKLFSRRVGERKGSDQTTPSGSVFVERSERPKRTYRESTDRSDTLSEVYTMDDDSMSIRSSIPERGASVTFPPDVAEPIPTGRDRRAVSLPTDRIERPPIPPHVRRARTESSDSSMSNVDRPQLSGPQFSISESLDDVSLPFSPEDRDRRAISLPPVTEEKVHLLPHEQRRAFSEVPEVPDHSRSTNLSSVSPGGVQSLSPLESDPSPVSPQASDMMSLPESSIDEGTGSSSDLPVNGVSHSATPSVASSVASAMAEGYQGWLAQGSEQDDSHLTSNLPAEGAQQEDSHLTPDQPGSSGVTFNPLVQLQTPSPDLSSESSSFKTSSLSSFSEPHCSDIGGFFPYFKREFGRKTEKAPDPRQRQEPGKMGSATGAIPKTTKSEFPSGPVPQTSAQQGRASTSGTLMKASEQSRTTNPQLSVPEGHASASGTEPSGVPEVTKGCLVIVSHTVMPPEIVSEPVPQSSEGVQKATGKAQAPKRKRNRKKGQKMQSEPEEMARKKREDEDSDKENPDDKEQNP